MTEETKEKLRQKALLRKHSEETKFKIGAAQIGRKRSLETRMKMSVSAKKNNARYWSGKKFSKDSCEKKSKSLMGRIFSDDTKTKMSLSAKGRWIGEKNPNWKGGKTEESIRVRTSPEYKRWRTSVFKRDGYTCILCGTRRGPFNADHIKPFSTHPELRLEPSNGRTLCEPCHRQTDTYGVNLMRKRLTANP